MENTQVIEKKQAEINDLLGKIDLLNQLKTDFKNLKDETFRGISLRTDSFCVTLNSYVTDSPYTSIVNNLIDALPEKIDEEIQTIEFHISTLNKEITDLQPSDKN